MGVRSHAAPPAPRPRSRGPGLAGTLVVVLVAFGWLVANGRPLSAPEQPQAAVWLLGAGLALASRVIQLDAVGGALVGKALAALFAALAAGALYAAVARRHGSSEGRWAGLALALGTTLAAAAQGFSGEPVATWAVAFAVLLLVTAEEEARAAPARLAGLPLGVAVAFQPSAAALALVLLLAVIVRFRASGLAALAWAAPGFLLALVTAAWSGSGSQAQGALAGGHLWEQAAALIASPARGLLLFAPVVLPALVGVVRGMRRPKHRLWDQAQPSVVLPAACLLAAVAHLACLCVLGGWDAGPFFGPRLVAPLFPPLLLFLPEAFAALRLGATVLVVGSIGVQALGLLSYDGRWDKLYGTEAGPRRAGTWDFTKSPIVFHARERQARIAIPSLEDGRLSTRPRAFAPRSAAGSFVAFARLPPVPTGADATFDGLRFEADARFESRALALKKPGDGLAFNVREGARPRRLEIRVVGRGQGLIGVGESGSGSGTRWREESVAGSFRLRLPYFYADSGGADVRVVLRSGGPVFVESVALVPPGEPDDVLRLP